LNSFIKNSVLRGDIISTDPILKYFNSEKETEIKITESYGTDLFNQKDQLTPAIPSFRQVQIEHFNMNLTKAESIQICSTIGGRLVIPEYSKMIKNNQEWTIYDVEPNSSYFFEFNHDQTTEPGPILQAFDLADQKIFEIYSTKELFDKIYFTNLYLDGTFVGASSDSNFRIKIQNSAAEKLLTFYLNNEEKKSWDEAASVATYAVFNRSDLVFYELNENKEVVLPDSVIDYSKYTCIAWASSTSLVQF